MELNACKLTHRGIKLLCEFVKSKSIIANAECWKRGLRFPDVNGTTNEGCLNLLSLAYNQLTDESIIMILDCLSEDFGLKFIDLRNNVGTIGVLKYLDEALLNNETVEYIDLRETGIGKLQAYIFYFMWII